MRGLEFARQSPYVAYSLIEGSLPMALANPVKFIQEVRAEIAKVVWPTRREVIMTTIMVFIMAALTAVFFSLVDLVIRSGLAGVLTYFGG